MASCASPARWLLAVFALLLLVFPSTTVALADANPTTETTPPLVPLSPVATETGSSATMMITFAPTTLQMALAPRGELHAVRGDGTAEHHRRHVPRGLKWWDGLWPKSKKCLCTRTLDGLVVTKVVGLHIAQLNSDPVFGLMANEVAQPGETTITITAPATPQSSFAPQGGKDNISSEIYPKTCGCSGPYAGIATINISTNHVYVLMSKPRPHFWGLKPTETTITTAIETASTTTAPLVQPTGERNAVDATLTPAPAQLQPRRRDTRPSQEFDDGRPTPEKPDASTVHGIDTVDGFKPLRNQQTSNDTTEYIDILGRSEPSEVEEVDDNSVELRNKKPAHEKGWYHAPGGWVNLHNAPYSDSTIDTEHLKENAEQEDPEDRVDTPLPPAGLPKPGKRDLVVSTSTLPLPELQLRSENAVMTVAPGSTGHGGDGFRDYVEAGLKRARSVPTFTTRYRDELIAAVVEDVEREMVGGVVGLASGANSVEEE